VQAWPLSFIVRPLVTTSLQSQEFDQVVSLRDSYRIMESFVESYLSRGGGSVSDFLHTYASSTSNGFTADPAAPNDYLAAFNGVLPNGQAQ